jgi:hypothetical protein
MTPFGLPNPPGIGESPFKVAGNLAKVGIGGIKQLASDIDNALGNIDTELSRLGTLDYIAPTKTKESAEVEGVSDDSTYRFQLDLLISNAQDLETVHLPNKGRIGGKPCDCITKHARTLGFHAKETIPIASRQGKDFRIFAEISTLADHLMLIGTKDAVETGKYDDEYLQQAGAMSTYRKKLEDLLGQAHVSYSEECANCPTTLSLKAFTEKRKQAAGKESTKAIKEATTKTET